MKVYSGPRISSSVLSLSNVLIFLSTILTFECGKFLIIMAWGWRYFTVISSPVIQKSGGAWMGNFVEQSTLNETHPVIYNVCNYQKPAAGEPALLLWDDVITLFHEFGHTLHGLLPASVMPRFPAPTRRVILSNFRRKSTNTGQHIRRYLLATPGIIRAGPQCLTNFNRKCVMPVCSIKGMR